MVTKLTALQLELVNALVDSGLTKETLVEALQELEPYPVCQTEEAQGAALSILPNDGSKPESLPTLVNGHSNPEKLSGDESSEDGDDDYDTPAILKEPLNLSPEEAAQQRAIVEQLL
eukprot:g46672.t1